MSRFSRRLRRLRTDARRHPVRILAIVGGGVVVLGLVWIVVTGVLAARAAQQAQQDLRTLKAQLDTRQLTGLGPSAADLEKQAAQAQSLTSGPAWWITAHVPVLGAPAAQVRAAAQAAHVVSAQALPELLDAADGLDPAALRENGHTLRLAPIQAARPHLARAAAGVAAAQRILAGAPTSGWVSAIDSRVGAIQTELTSLGRYVQAADTGSRLLPPLLGADGPRRYFVGLQNEAEMRGTGGIPGVFAILVADHGSLRFTQFRSDSAIDDGGGPGVAKTDVPLAAAYTAAYGRAQPSRVFVNSNISPDFPQAARIWAAMWERVSHQHIDGAVAVDPTTLSYLLKVTGPTSLPGGRVVSADNVVDLTERNAYSSYPNTAARKAFLVHVTEAAETKLLSGSGDPAALIAAFGQAAGGNRMQVWSSRPAEETLLQRTALSGSFPGAGTTLAAPIVTNVAATKLDYYLHRSVTVERLGCGSARQLHVTMSLTNSAPTKGLPAYVRTRQDVRAPDTPKPQPGDNRLWVDYVASDGATLLASTLDGEKVGLQTLTVAGHPAFRYDLELPAGATVTLDLRLADPTSGPIQVWRQPGVHALHSTVYDSCG